MLAKVRRELIIAIVAVGLALVLAEVCVSIVAPQPTWRRIRASNPAMYAVDDTMPFKLRPGYAGPLVRNEFAVHVHINSLGFRGREISRDKRPGVFRVLGLGDSFTFGYGVEDDETYLADAERILRTRPATRTAELLNAGFGSGYAPDTYYLFAKRSAASLHPDLITVGLFIGNDIEGRDEDRWVDTDDRGLPTVIENIESRVDDEGYFVLRKPSFANSVPVLRQSHLFHLIGAAVRRVRSGPSNNKIPGLYAATFESHTSDAFDRCIRLIAALVSEASKQRVPVAVILIPAREQVLAKTIQPSAMVDYAHPNRVLVKAFEERRIPVIDLLDAMRQSDRRTAFYFPEDQHWTPTGHTFAGARIAEFIASHDRRTAR